MRGLTLLKGTILRRVVRVPSCRETSVASPLQEKEMIAMPAFRITLVELVVELVGRGVELVELKKRTLKEI